MDETPAPAPPPADAPAEPAATRATPWITTMVAFLVAVRLISGAFMPKPPAPNAKTQEGELAECVAAVKGIRDGCFRFVKDPITLTLKILPIPIINFILILPALMLLPFIGLFGVALSPIVWLLQAALLSVQAVSALFTFLRVSTPMLGFLLLSVSVGLVLEHAWASVVGRVLMVLAILAAPLAFIIGGLSSGLPATVFAMGAWWELHHAS